MHDIHELYRISCNTIWNSITITRFRFPPTILVYCKWFNKLNVRQHTVFTLSAVAGLSVCVGGDVHVWKRNCVVLPSCITTEQQVESHWSPQSPIQVSPWADLKFLITWWHPAHPDCGQTPGWLPLHQPRSKVWPFFGSVLMRPLTVVCADCHLL